jgi:WD40 repeat protein
MKTVASFVTASRRGGDAAISARGSALMASKIDLASLRKLQDLFGADGELDEGQFVEAFGGILGDGLSRLQLSHLFMKIDANSDGSVDWDELLNYMFLDNQEQSSSEDTAGGEDEEASTKFFPATYDIFALNNDSKNQHKEQVSSLLYLDRQNQLLSASRDGVLRLWHPTTLKHQGSFQTGAHSARRGKDGALDKDWITAVVVLSQSNKLAVASIDSGISIFDLAVESRKRCGHISMERLRHHAPLCLGYYYNESTGREHLLVGDDSGAAHVFFQDDGQWCVGVEGVSATGIAAKSRLARSGLKRGDDDADGLDSGEAPPPNKLDFPPLLGGGGKGGGGKLATGSSGSGSGSGFISGGAGSGVGVAGATAATSAAAAAAAAAPVGGGSHSLSKTDRNSFVVRKHTDHITQIDYIADISSLVTCSLDTTVVVYDLERRRHKRTFLQHSKPVYSFAWLPVHKVIASCGLERHIVLWSPYSKRGVATLHGHASSVLKLTVNDQSGQLLSLSSDNTVKVWDIRNLRCVQTIPLPSQDVAPGAQLRVAPPSSVGCFQYVAKHRALVLASTKLHIFPLKQPSGEAAATCQGAGAPTKTHNRAVVSALYNPAFHQVISVDERANLNIWNVGSGAIISRFKLRTRADTAGSDSVDASARLAAAAAESTTLAAAGLPSEPTLLGAAGSGSAPPTSAEPVDAIKAAAEISLSMENDEGSTLTKDCEDQSITAICFDEGGRRLVTGSHGGADLKVWNFSNGCLLKTLVKDEDSSSAAGGGPGMGAGAHEDVDSYFEHLQQDPVERAKRARRRSRLRRLKGSGRDSDGDSGVATCPPCSSPQSPTLPRSPPCPHELLQTLDGGLAHATPAQRRLKNPFVGSNEVTRIAYVVNVLPHIPGHPTIKNKYVVSVGWDRRIYLWTDGASDDNTQGYSLRMPEKDSELDHGHTDDITTLSFLPPDIVATGGYDGRVIFWCLSSGKLTQRFALGDVGIEASVFVRRFGVLVVTRCDGSALTIDVSSGRVQPLLSMQAMHKAPPVVALCSDVSDDVLASGDEAGSICIWDIVDPARSGATGTAGRNSPSGLLQRCAHWRAHERCVASLSYVQDNGLAETFLVSGCVDGQVSLWTLNGVPVGHFGQSEPWDLDAHSQRTSKASYDASVSVSLNTLSEVTIASSLDVQLEDRGGERAQISPVAALAAGDRSVYKSFPCVGEVWVKIEMDGIKQVRPFNCEVTGHAQVPPKVVLAVVTVTRHDEVRNEIKGWCGLAPDKRELMAPVMEFLSDRESGQWIREESLTDMVGRIYEDRSTGAPFKVQFFRCRDKRWLAVDPAGIEHVIYYVTKTYFGLRPPRSISLYYRRLEIIAQLEQAAADKQQLSRLLKNVATIQSGTHPGGSGSESSVNTVTGSFKLGGSAKSRSRRASLSIANPATAESSFKLGGSAKSSSSGGSAKDSSRRASLLIVDPATAGDESGSSSGGITKNASRRGSFLDLFLGEEAKASTSTSNLHESSSSTICLDGGGRPLQEQQHHEQQQQVRAPERVESAAAKAQRPNTADSKQVSSPAPAQLQQKPQSFSPSEGGRDVDSIREPGPTRDPYPCIPIPAGLITKSRFSSQSSPAPPTQPLSPFTRDNPSWRHRSAARAATSAQAADCQPVRQRVHAIADVPVDFAQLRATLSFGTDRPIL